MVVDTLVEGLLDETVARRLITYSGHTPGTGFGKRGVDYLHARAAVTPIVTANVSPASIKAVRCSVQPLPAQQRSELSPFRARIRRAQDAQLVLGVETPPFGFRRHLWIRLGHELLASVEHRASALWELYPDFPAVFDSLIKDTEGYCEARPT
jgi:hypothetical protein